jgi:hypothetical protein
MSSLNELIAWIDDRHIALVSGTSALPNAAEAIVGRRIEGSWWGDPLGSLIFRLLSELEDDAPQYLDVALVEGKRTLVSPPLTPSVLAVASDPDRRHRVAATLKQPARRLLEVLADGRTARSGDPALVGSVGRNARTALEAGLLARSTSVHTASGHHASLVETFGEPSLGRDQPAGDLGALVQAALEAAVVAERGEVERWFRFVEPDRERRALATDGLGAREIRTGGRVWLTLDVTA